MKKITYLLALTGLLLSSSIYAGSSALFTYNANKVQAQLSSLDIVDTFVEANNLNYTDLVRTNLSLASTLNYGQTSVFGIQNMEPPLGIPSIVWGACGNLGGIALVYFITEDKEETKKAAYGCVGGTVLIAGCWIGYIVLIVGASAI